MTLKSQAEEVAQLRERLASRTTDELRIMVTFQEQDYRPAAIAVAWEELRSRGVEHIDQEKATELKLVAERDLPTRWLSFLTWNLPVAIVSMVVGVVQYFSITAALVTLCFVVFWSFLFVGLYRRRLWGWKLLWIHLASAIVAPSIGETEYGLAWLFVTVVVAGFWFYPNYIYFKRRRHLFEYVNGRDSTDGEQHVSSGDGATRNEPTGPIEGA